MDKRVSTLSIDDESGPEPMHLKCNICQKSCVCWLIKHSYYCDRCYLGTSSLNEYKHKTVLCCNHCGRLPATMMCRMSSKYYCSADCWICKH